MTSTTSKRLYNTYFQAPHPVPVPPTSASSIVENATIIVSAWSQHYRFAAMWWAASSGRVETVRELLLAGAECDALDEYGQTALLVAADGGHTEVVRTLLEHGADTESRHHSNQRTALMRAAARGHAAVVRVLLLFGADVEACTPEGSTALLLAAHAGHAAVVQLLLQAGANCEHRDERNRTALMLALIRGFGGVVKELLAYNANPFTVPPAVLFEERSQPLLPLVQTAKRNHRLLALAAATLPLTQPGSASSSVSPATRSFASSPLFDRTLLARILLFAYYHGAADELLDDVIPAEAPSAEDEPPRGEPQATMSPDPTSVSLSSHAVSAMTTSPDLDSGGSAPMSPEPVSPVPLP